MKKYDVIIIGAGAAGLMCAAVAGQRGRKVLLIDHAKKIGEKIRISGGGRCNFTNLNVSEKNFISKNSHFCISALKRFTSQDFINLVKKHKIDFHEKTLGQLFCDFSSQQIIDMLLAECRDGNVEIQMETKVEKILKNEDLFEIFTTSDKVFAVESEPPYLGGSSEREDQRLADRSGVSGVHNLTSESLVIATGGLSIPKIGATDFGYKIAQQFGLKIIETQPALVPFILPEKLLNETKNLAGVSCEVIASCGKTSFREALLFTHRGLSGPAILQISSYWQKGEAISINFLPQTDIAQEIEKARQINPKQELVNFLSNFLPKKLAEFLSNKINHSGNLADLSKAKIQQISQIIHNWKVIPSGTEGYLKAEVTSGGIDTDEISSKNFTSKKVPNLFFIGEVLDVTGWLGGYNFQWAWASGKAAGESL